MNILDNELISKYFGCEANKWDCKFPEAIPYPKHLCVAYRVLAAMETPIRKGELFLWLKEDGTINEVVQVKELGTSSWHPDELRLPSSFQPKAEKCCCGESDSIHRTDGPCYKIQKPDPVEESSKEIIDTVEIHGKLWLEMKLRELVALARETQVTRPPARGMK